MGYVERYHPLPIVCYLKRFLRHAVLLLGFLWCILVAENYLKDNWFIEFKQTRDTPMHESMFLNKDRKQNIHSK